MPAAPLVRARSPSSQFGRSGRARRESRLLKRAELEREQVHDGQQHPFRERSEAGSGGVRIRDAEVSKDGTSSLMRPGQWRACTKKARREEGVGGTGKGGQKPGTGAAGTPWRDEESHCGVLVDPNPRMMFNSAGAEGTYNSSARPAPRPRQWLRAQSDEGVLLPDRHSGFRPR